MRLINLILILLIGSACIYLSFSAKYSAFFGDDFIWAFMIILGVFAMGWGILQDLKKFNASKRISSFSLTIICILLIGINLIVHWQIQLLFKKPTTLSAYHSLDWNATSLDFKVDGNYIISEHSLGTTYHHGTYQIAGNKILLDRNPIHIFRNSAYLEIFDSINSENKSEKWIRSIDSVGKNNESLYDFWVTDDNR